MFMLYIIHAKRFMVGTLQQQHHPKDATKRLKELIEPLLRCSLLTTCLVHSRDILVPIDGHPCGPLMACFCAVTSDLQTDGIIIFSLSHSIINSHTLINSPKFTVRTRLYPIIVSQTLQHTSKKTNAFPCSVLAGSQCGDND